MSFKFVRQLPSPEEIQKSTYQQVKHTDPAGSHMVRFQKCFRKRHTQNNVSEFPLHILLSFSYKAETVLRQSRECISISARFSLSSDFPVWSFEFFLDFLLSTDSAKAFPADMFSTLVLP